MSLRRVYVHIIEEYAGATATLTLRERIDGVSGCDRRARRAVRGGGRDSASGRAIRYAARVVDLGGG
jgi:hypothetical protein